MKHKSIGVFTLLLTMVSNVSIAPEWVVPVKNETSKRIYLSFYNTGLCFGPGGYFTIEAGETKSIGGAAGGSCRLSSVAIGESQLEVPGSKRIAVYKSKTNDKGETINPKGLTIKMVNGQTVIEENK